MNVASVELGNQLFEVSGWEADVAHLEDRKLYSLGYLVRRLPVGVVIKRLKHGYSARPEGLWPYKSVEQQAQYMRVRPVHADTPEDAAAQLCIQLLKVGVLTRGSHG